MEEVRPQKYCPSQPFTQQLMLVGTQLIDELSPSDNRVLPPWTDLGYRSRASKVQSLAPSLRGAIRAVRTPTHTDSWSPSSYGRVLQRTEFSSVIARVIACSNVNCKPRLTSVLEGTSPSACCASSNHRSSLARSVRKAANPNLF